MHSVSKHMRLSEPVTKMWIKIDPYYQRRRWSPMTLVSANIGLRFMRIFAGFPAERRQHYYIVLFSLLSPFYWPQNTWHCVTFNGHFTFNFRYYEPRFQQLGYIVIVEPIYKIVLLYDVASRDVGKRTVIRRILRLRERTADFSKPKSCGCYIVGILTK